MIYDIPIYILVIYNTAIAIIIVITNIDVYYGGLYALEVSDA